MNVNANNTIPHNINQWEEYLNNINPNIIKLGLERVKQAAIALGVDTFPNSRIVTVAGTNGKGSTSSMLAKILDNAGIKTGLYTSPHLRRFSERIICEGIEASNDELCNAFEKVYQVQDPNNPLTFFEFTTLAALYIFKERDCEVLVLEVGLGGRLDAVNILDADIVIKPSIGLDHCHLLGNTLADIAHEKAGVIKPITATTIVGDLPKEALEVIEKKVYDYKGILHVLNKNIIPKWKSAREFDLEKPIELKDVKVPTLPPINAPLSIAAAMFLTHVFKLNIEEKDLRTGILEARLRGRFEEISQEPHVIIDVAHNPPAAQYLHSCIQQLGNRRRYALIGMLKDKDIANTLEILASDFERFYACSLPSERGATKETIKRSLVNCGVDKSTISMFKNVSDAYEIALVELPEDADLYIFGSFLTVDAILKYEEDRVKPI